jgi:hypothetical protein
LKAGVDREVNGGTGCGTGALWYIAWHGIALSRIWKLKRPKSDDGDDIKYIIGSTIAFVAIVGGYAYHVDF